MSMLRRSTKFRVIGARVDQTTEGTLTVARDGTIASYRPLHSHHEYRLTLCELCEMLVSRAVKQDLAAKGKL